MRDNDSLAAPLSVPIKGKIDQVATMAPLACEVHYSDDRPATFTPQDVRGLGAILDHAFGRF